MSQWHTLRKDDVNTGETPIGTARRNGPFGIPSYLPFKIGTPNNDGAVLTESGLIFIGAATDNLIRAIDLETGGTRGRTFCPPVRRPTRSAMRWTGSNTC